MVHDEIVAVGVPASMGPRSFERGNPQVFPYYGNECLLQWGLVLSNEETSLGSQHIADRQKLQWGLVLSNEETSGT